MCEDRNTKGPEITPFRMNSGSRTPSHPVVGKEIQHNPEVEIRWIKDKPHARGAEKKQRTRRFMAALAEVGKILFSEYFDCLLRTINHSYCQILAIYYCTISNILSNRSTRYPYRLNASERWINTSVGRTIIIYELPTSVL
jgi:hypothetical protein